MNKSSEMIEFKKAVDDYLTFLAVLIDRNMDRLRGRETKEKARDLHKELVGSGGPWDVDSKNAKEARRAVILKAEKSIGEYLPEVAFQWPATLEEWLEIGEINYV